MKIAAPWTEAQVEALNRWQTNERVHEFTCPVPHAMTRVLVATTSGWRCPTCGYRQDWAHDFMVKT